MANLEPIQLLTYRERLVGWLRFLVCLIGLIMVTKAAARVYEHWSPADANPLLFAITTFFRFLWPRLLIGAAIGAFFLAIAMLFKLRPP
ncbi:MAG: hypothetical protein AB8B55_04460 [Mariniblastus sp.]